MGHKRARARWCHMVADTEAELHAMADKIGLRREWYQGDHYDIVQNGAKEANRHEFIAVLRAVRQKGKSLAHVD